MDRERVELFALLRVLLDFQELDDRQLELRLELERVLWAEVGHLRPPCDELFQPVLLRVDWVLRDLVPHVLDFVLDGLAALVLELPALLVWLLRAALERE